MSATNTNGGLLSPHSIGGFGYGIAVSVGILILITTITLASYYCTRSNTTNFVLPTTMNPSPAGDQAEAEAEAGLDEATLSSYPKLVYSEAKANHKDSTAACCSICLADYRTTDVLRRLPDCEHLFHLKCVDPWLRYHPTCPICRTSPLPSPVSTPLAEVIPLATRPIGL